MSTGPGDFGIDALPRAIPVFPLSGALLLPHGHLPLTIFEPRYLNMIDDALGAGRMIGMVQPKVPCRGLIADDAAFYAIGCAGRIVSFEELEGGRYRIALRGICRFRSLGELAGERGYRRIVAAYDDFAADIAGDGDAVMGRERLLHTVRRYFALKHIDIDWQALEQAADEALVTSLSMLCPFAAGEQQALLEADGLVSRGALLGSLLEMALLEAGGEGGPVRH